MKWRRVPPVYSPIAIESLLSGARAALGSIADCREKLEADLSTAYGAKQVVLTDSGTSALQLAIRAAAPEASIIAVPGYACIDIIAAAIGARVRVVAYDIDPTTLSPDLNSVRNSVRSGASALVVAPLYGYPVDMNVLKEIASEYAVPLIEDAAQGAGAAIGKSLVGSLGDASILSFGRGKGITGGSGGALLVRNDLMLANINRLKLTLQAGSSGFWDLGMLAAQWLFGRPQLYLIPTSIPALGLGEMIYKPPRPPAHISRAAAHIITRAIRGNVEELTTRRARAAELMAVSRSSGRFVPVRVVKNGEPGYLRFAVLDATGIASPASELGILRGYPITLIEHPETQRVLADPHRDLPGASKLRDRLFTIPTHSLVNDDDASRMALWLSGAFPSP